MDIPGCIICTEPLEPRQPLFRCSVCHSGDIHLACAVEWFAIHRRNPCCNTDADIALDVVPRSEMTARVNELEEEIRGNRIKLNRLGLCIVILAWGYVGIPVFYKTMSDYVDSS